MTSPGTPAPRACDYCDAPFTPVADSQRFCKKTHQVKAARRRRHGLVPKTPPLLTTFCAWCGQAFATYSADQRFCGPEHKAEAAACDRKQAYSLLATAARIALRHDGAGVTEPYLCPRPRAREHWHLRSRTGDSA